MIVLINFRLFLHFLIPETEKKSDSKKSFFEFKVPRTGGAAGGAGPGATEGDKKDYVVQTIEVDGPLDYGFGHVLELINAGFFNDADDEDGVDGGDDADATSKFASNFQIVFPSSASS